MENNKNKDPQNISGLNYFFINLMRDIHWREVTFDILRFWDFEKKISRITSQKNDKFYISFLNYIGVIRIPESQNISNNFTD